MNTTHRKQFKRAVIEAIHGLPYGEAVKKEFVWDYRNDEEAEGEHGTITIGRVMQALPACFGVCIRPAGGKIMEWISGDKWKVHNIYWKLTKNGRECTDDNQTDETINALLKLLS